MSLVPADRELVAMVGLAIPSEIWHVSSHNCLLTISVGSVAVAILVNLNPYALYTPS